jgi:hypothetical protein
MRTVAEECVLFVSSCPAAQHLLALRELARRSELRSEICAPLGDLSPGGGPGSEGGSEELLGSPSGAPICERSSEGGSEELLDLGVPLGGEAQPAQVSAVAGGEELHGALQRGLECRHLVHRV